METMLLLLLTIMILLLIAYLFFLKKDLKRIRKNIKTIQKSGSNQLLHGAIPCKKLDALINEINCLLQQTKEEKIHFERKNTELKKMITNISHDLRTPLTSALGYIDILLSSPALENPENPKNLEDLKIIRERLKRLEELIDSFFTFSRVTLQEEPLLLEPVNIIAILEECIASHYEDYRNADREIQWENPVPRFKIQSNQEMLTRVFDNLIQNALKHSSGNLLIKTENKSPFQILFTNELVDSDLDIEHMFDEFYTIDIARTKSNTGLGLAIAKEFMKSLGGSIHAEKNGNTLNMILTFPDTAGDTW